MEWIKEKIELNHIPPKQVNKGTPYEVLNPDLNNGKPGKGYYLPVASMGYIDHRNYITTKNAKYTTEQREKFIEGQKNHMMAGRFHEAFKMDIKEMMKIDPDRYYKNIKETAKFLRDNDYPRNPKLRSCNALHDGRLINEKQYNEILSYLEKMKSEFSKT